MSQGLFKNDHFYEGLFFFFSYSKSKRTETNYQIGQAHTLVIQLSARLRSIYSFQRTKYIAKNKCCIILIHLVSFGFWFYCFSYVSVYCGRLPLKMMKMNKNTEKKAKSKMKPLAIWWFKKKNDLFLFYSQILAFMIRSNFWICRKERKSRKFLFFFGLLLIFKMENQRFYDYYRWLLLLCDCDAVYCCRFCFFRKKPVNVIVSNGDTNLVTEWKWNELPKIVLRGKPLIQLTQFNSNSSLW